MAHAESFANDAIPQSAIEVAASRDSLRKKRRSHPPIENRGQMTDDLSSTLDREIPLFEMIQTLRNELTASMNLAEKERLKFQVVEVELELRVHVSRERSAEGKVSFWVLGLSAKGTQTAQDTHVFKLKLKPTASNADGEEGLPVQVGDTSQVHIRQPGPGDTR